MFYVLSITLATLIIALANLIAAGVCTARLYFKLTLTTSLGVIAVIAIDGFLAFIARRLPERWFSPDVALFNVTKRERLIYRRLKINRWKSLVPELGCFTGFHKDKVREPSSAEYIARFITESNYGVLGHILGAVLGFAIIFIPKLPLSVSLPIAEVNFILNILPTMILRFNTPPLKRLYERNLARDGATE